MKYLLRSGILLFCWTLGLGAQNRTVKLKIIQTSDIHGNYYPYNFITCKKASGGLSQVFSYVAEKRKTYKENLLLLDNGDILQGQPTAYYYNYIDTVSPHLCADLMNEMGYDVGNMGNHDVETGRAVFSRWIRDCKFPILGANIIDVSTEKPYLPPYKIIVRDGLRIAILGLITPAIPAWLPENLWKGLRFDDMEQTASKWMDVIKSKEKPDVIIGLFHAGQNAMRMSDKYNENASLDVAKKVPGFDVVMFGHDHSRECRNIVNVAGDSVLVVNPANDGLVVGDVDVTLTLNGGKVVRKSVKGVLTDVQNCLPDNAFLVKFQPQYNQVKSFVSKKIGTFEKRISIRPAYFGPSAFIDFIHSLQLEITGADISFTAPLSFDTQIDKGNVTVGDMFKLYKFENMLYVMTLSGKEIKDYLEESYFYWTNQMKSEHDCLLKFKEKQPINSDNWNKLKYYSFNFDSASGICYTVDVTKPKGEKIIIKSMADGQPFDMYKTYKVALNSYRGNGGGELLTKGAGIPVEQLSKRILFSTDKDLRYYLMKSIEKKGLVVPHALHQWKFIPERWTKSAAERDYKYLFNENNTEGLVD